MTLLSQRDPRWSQIKLGFSNSVTIGSHGCFITSLAMLIGTTPDVVNNRLKTVNGFVSESGNLIWNKIPEAFPGITITHLLHPYNNDVVKTNIPALVTVDGTPIGAPLHAVLYIGNQQLADPWTGKVESTSKYRPFKFVVIKGKWSQSQNKKGESSMDDNIKRKSYFFDLYWHALYGDNVDTDKVTKEQVEARIWEAKSEKYRSGEWDKLARMAGFTGDTSSLIRETLYQLISRQAIEEAQGDKKAVLAEMKSLCLQLDTHITHLLDLE